MTVCNFEIHFTLLADSDPKHLYCVFVITLLKLQILEVQDGPKVGIPLLNYFLHAFKLPAVLFMLLVKYHKHCLFFIK